MDNLDVILEMNDPQHQYVRRFVGCGHGVLFKDYCRDCEVILLVANYKNSQKTIQRVRNRLKEMGFDDFSEGVIT